MNIRFLTAHLTRDLREIVHRARHNGAASAWTCARTHAANALLLAMAKFHRAPRVWCPCCGWAGYAFRAVDAEACVLYNSECPQCVSHERHRMTHLFLTARPPAFLKDGKRVLHFAPERHLRGFLDGPGALRCVSADLAPEKLRLVGGPAFRTDIQCLPLPDATWDGLVCIHVLEHVDDDRRAVDELRRILKPGGQALIMVPFGMHLERTAEYGRGHEIMFGHVRDYSPRDFSERLGGFHFEEIRPSALFTREEQRRYGIPDSEIIYLCTK